MFYQLFIILQIFLYQSSLDNFEGIIKYNVPNTTDSLIYYIRSDKIRIHRKGNFVAKYGNYTDEFMDLENNRVALYNSKEGDYDFVGISDKKYSLTLLEDSAIVLNERCQGYLLDYGEVGYGSKMRDRLYVSDNLHFKAPNNCKILNSMVVNGSGKIALKQVRIVERNDDNGESFLEAVEIIPMEISDSLLLF